MSEAVPVNPELLRWARESAGLSVDEVVNILKRKRITAEVIEAWESGLGGPDYAQLERLAYEVYKRPLALFFFPEPPEEVTPTESFRTLPDFEIKILPTRIRMLLRKARVLQLNLVELYDGMNPSESNIVQALSFDIKTPESEMGARVRSFLSVDLDQQLAWKNANEALKFWRETLEEHGIFVFKDAFKAESFSGFCLYDEQFPLIYVNNSKSATRQIFTLFHELAHLLFKTGGVDTRIDDYIDYLDGDDRRIEVLCNSFAGEFLVPSDDFDHRVTGLSIDESYIQKLADTYCVSREVILRKCFDRHLVDQSYYDYWVHVWAQQGGGEKGNGGNYYFTQGVYLGTNYIEKAFARYYQNQISIERLADYLGVKVKNVDGMESLLFRKESAV